MSPIRERVGKRWVWPMTLLRAEYAKQFGLNPAQACKLSPYLITRMERCQSDEARHLLVNGFSNKGSQKKEQFYENGK